MREGEGERKKQNQVFIHAIEEKALHPEYKAGRKSIYEELERILPEKKYFHALSIIDCGYSLLRDESPTNQISGEIWNFSQHLQSIVEKKHREFAEKYPKWFNENLKLQVKLTHPLNHPPSNYPSSQGESTIIGQLSSYLRPYFVTKTGIAEMIAQIFLYFYGRDYPEIDPKKIVGLL